jgi:glycosyltransferase involved in cell wall biosynthesis
MYCQLPAITFTIDGSGVNWVSLNSETGIEVSNSNALEFGNAIEKLLSNDALRDQYGRNAKRRVEENFLMEIVGPQYNQLYKSLKS